MASNDMLIGYVLDKSSSMAGLTPATIEGFNKFVNDQKNESGRTWMSLTLFSEQFEVRYVAWDVNDIPPMSVSGDNPYIAYGNTALYDAVGITIDGISAWLDDNEWFDGKVLIAVWTDGEENASRHWSLDRLNKAIAEKQAQGFEFLFMGAGSSAWLEAKKFTSLANDQILTFASSDAATNASYAGASTSASMLRNFGSSAYRSENQVTQTVLNNAGLGDTLAGGQQVDGNTVSITDASRALSGKPVHKGRITTPSEKRPGGSDK